ncbi:MAG: STAS domain-containing protein [Planctomycetaceae bacterium]
MQRNDFLLEWHGDAIVVAPSGSAESLEWTGVEQAADLVFGQVRDREVPLVVFDLGDLQYFGSVFMAMLLRCHKLLKYAGGELVLANVGANAKELLRLTGLDTLWAIYDTRDQALEAIGA